ncbi:MAG: hypothetical protein A2W21_07340 [Betaproteobacteria bacterium RBG_16_66_20]|nr:MAG: hypothetical protein A2W21_07340 [Betaproteobacteria bacterium RBG_16_66_20]
MLGLAGSAEPAGRPDSVSGIGSVRIGIRLRCASAALMASIRASIATQAAERFTRTCLAIGESTIPPE